jgi:hypothetical protein
MKASRKIPAIGILTDMRMKKTPKRNSIFLFQRNKVPRWSVLMGIRKAGDLDQF